MDLSRSPRGVLAKNSDPRSGESTMRLPNIDRNLMQRYFERLPTIKSIDENDRGEIKITQP
jgi:hypothetical protein